MSSWEFGRKKLCLFLGEGEAVDGFAFEGFVRVEVLAGGFDVAVAHQPLHGDAARLHPRAIK